MIISTIIHDSNNNTNNNKHNTNHTHVGFDYKLTNYNLPKPLDLIKRILPEG